MLKLLVLFAHLLGVCLAIGTIALTDLRLLARVTGYRVVIARPTRFETRIVAVALALLYLSGAALLSLGAADDPRYLSNPKLQAKLLLVALLTANAVALHRWVFPILERSHPVSRWSRRARLTVALFVGLSNSLWMYCAFLGIARPWNHTVPLWQVLGGAVLPWAAFAGAVVALLWFAARDEPRGDWVDSMKSTLSGLGAVGDYRHDFEPHAAPRADTGPVPLT